MREKLLIALRVGLRRDVHGNQWLVAASGDLALPDARAPERAPVDRLLSSPTAPDELERLAAQGGTIGLARWFLWARRARERGLLFYRFQIGNDRPLADLVPIASGAPDFIAAPPRAAPGIRVQLSRFAVLHRTPLGLTLESPLATMRAELSLEGAAAVADCVDPVSADGRMFLAALLAAGLVAEVGDDDLLAEEHDVALSQWELHDLLLHARTRTARVGAPRGGTYRFAEDRPSPPATAHSSGALNADGQIALYRPDLQGLLAEDPPFAEVMESRVSRRDLRPMTVAQLGEFLFRTMRVRQGGQAAEGSHEYPTADRPYPSAGGTYEFTTYLAIDACEGIPGGLYRYDPVRHGLDLVARTGPDLQSLLRDGGRAAGIDSLPPVLVVLAADFRRLSWKYEGIAYALTLKNVGVLLQSMQLAATAMGLGSCPLGAGDSELFARVAGTQPAEESSVGELMLGS